METCKNCGKPITWANRGMGMGFYWIHIETEINDCYPKMPTAEPTDNVIKLALNKEFGRSL